MPLVRRTRAILRSAEFGFLGVIVRTCRQTPRFWGAPGIETWRCRRLFQFLRMAGALIFLIAGWRPWRTSWLIVGTKTLLLSLAVTQVSMAFAVDGAGHSGSHGLVVPGDGTGIWGSKMVLGERAKGGPLPRPRRRSVRRPAERVKRSTGRDLPPKWRSG